MARPSYIELPAADIAAAKAFYASAFGWSLAEFGPTYAATTTGDVDVGLQGDMAEAPAAPLPVIQVDDLEAALHRGHCGRRRDRAADLRAFPAGAASSSATRTATNWR